MNPDEASRSLATIRATQAKAVGSQPWFPTWYAAGVGLLVTGVQFVTEPGTPVPVTVAGGVALTAALGALVALLVKARRMTAHRSAVSPAGIAAFLVWLLASVGICLAIALRLDAAEVAYARTYAGLAMTGCMAATGPFVARWISGQMARKIEKRV
ncbi:hypothetical protein [Microbispora sp. ATCC PTA-5024]|uniref:hypothetical protein n=1 Tax=Microbispora sp. ATCC PTA-5024 TaxID=316330 RepID=UPI0003DB7F2C|nr:hypothetical protein [Microbispora sp. ATCC PTA-5024]ETK31183.1 hypothetical protein MPTA5024_36100 [Microbispora sp. ATCC PTA-5024]